jgi:hypothetical protein
MSVNSFFAFEGIVDTDPDAELSGERTALTVAIAEAAMAAAQNFEQIHETLGLGPEVEELEFDITRIRITVSPNPGPTTYKVVITPTGS